MKTFETEKISELVGEEPSNRELLWRQYNLHIDLYKYYLDLSLKANAFFYLITGGILTFYFANSKDGLVKYSLLLPIIMSLAFGFSFIYGAKLMHIIRADIFHIRDELGFQTAPDVYVLCVFLNTFGAIFLIVGISMIVMLFAR